MSKALVFSGPSTLDFEDVRLKVLRIPEVMHSVREAQTIWDALNPSPFDLGNFIGSDDGVFLSHIKLRNFATSVVQVGLLRRYLRNNELPEFLIGTINGDSPLRVAIKQISFVEMVAESDAMPGERLALVPKDAPLLAGVKLDEFAVFKKGENDKYKRSDFDSRDLNKMLESLVDKEGLTEAIFVGPGSRHRTTPNKLKCTESIELDPALSWFFARPSSPTVSIAN